MSNDNGGVSATSAELGMLMSCPFCMAPAMGPYLYSGAPTISCTECPAMMGGEESNATDDELIAAWNRRA